MMHLTVLITISFSKSNKIKFMKPFLKLLNLWTAQICHYSHYEALMHPSKNVANVGTGSYSLFYIML